MILSIFFAVLFLGIAISRNGYTFLVFLDLFIGGANLAIALDKIFS